MQKTSSPSIKSKPISNLSLAALRQLPIADVASAVGLKLRGNKAMCFFGHDSASPSFTVNRAKNTWKCYGCGEFGDSISLVQRARGVGFLEACSWLCDNFGVSPGSLRSRHSFATRAPLSRHKPINRVADRDCLTNSDPSLYTWMVAHCGPVRAPMGIAYLRSHGIDDDVALQFGVVEMVDPARAYRALEKQWGAMRVRNAGLSGSRAALCWSGYALIFPFRSSGITHYLQVRCFQGAMKFFSPRGIPKPMFNSQRLEQLKRGSVLHICEGVPDAIAIEGMGLAAVAVLGAASFRSGWVEELLPFDLVGVPDGDAAGEKFKKCLSKEFRARSKSIRFVIPAEGMDASDVIARGKNA